MGTYTYSRHIRALTRLALPIVGSQFAAMFLWVVDVIMLGHLGTDSLGAASLSRVWIYGSMVFAMGLLFGIDPIASQAFGAKNFEALARNLKRGLLLALGLSMPVGLSWLLTGRILGWAGQDPLLSASAHLYALVQIPGLPFFLVFLVLKQFLQAQGIVMPELWITIGANLFNILVNWLLIFGHWGFPRLGVAGAGVATALTQILMACSLAYWMFRRSDQRRYWTGWNRAILQWAPFNRILGFGWPVAIQIGLEMWAFQITTLWAGWLGTTALAAHTVAITFASTSFMIPLGVAIASTVRVGNLIGAGRPHDAQRAAWTALGMGSLFMSISALVFFFGRTLLPELMTQDLAVILATAAILPIAAAFQIVDGLQVVGCGILRGMGHTRPAAFFVVVGYYVLALPLAWWMSFRAGLELAGLWWGLALGLTLCAIGLVSWVAFRGPAHVEARVDFSDL